MPSEKLTTTHTLSAICKSDTHWSTILPDNGRGSLIPQLPYGVGRVAIQSASRGGRIVRYMTDYEMAVKWIKQLSLSEDFRLLFTDGFQPTKGRGKEFVTRNCFSRVKNGVASPT